MKHRIRRIAPLQLGKMLGVLYALFGLIFLPFFAIAALAGAFAQQSQQAQAGSGAPVALATGAMVVLAFLFPVIYGAMGFIFGVISAAIYNLVARWIGGIEIDLDS